MISLEGQQDDKSWQATRLQFEDAVKRLTTVKPESRHVVDFKFPDGGSERFGMASEDEASRLTKTLTTLSKRTKR
ncbi:hypothetical protein [Variovorax sp. Varisp36]|uniref:hypothetical protein n=1 Tax=Variovorax sp. Varisp36 TaxID=3243031 RepID=UPI0039A54739